MSQKNTLLVDRRQALAMFGAAALGARTALAAATEPLFHFTGIDHINLAVADPVKSAAFYARIFGSNVLKAKKGSRYYVKAGPNYFALTVVGQGPRAKTESYYGVGVEGFQMKEAKHALEQAGIECSEAPGGGLLVIDPDGIPIQLSEQNSWSKLGNITSPAPVSGSVEPWVRPTQINHLLLADPDPDKSSAFYERIFGSPVTKTTQPKRIMFRAGNDRVSLSPMSANPSEKDQVNGQHLASGEKLGLDHFGFIAPFDRSTLTKQLQDFGAKVLPQVTSGPDAAAIDFRDPDGYRVQVSPPPKRG